MNEYALIVGGGSGTRMGGGIPKQFLPLGGIPVLLHTIRKFIAYKASIQIVLTLREEDFDYWREMVTRYEVVHPIILASGGATRYASVKNGLAYIRQTGLVAVHDAVRPLVSVEEIKNSFTLAAQYGAAVTATPLKDSIRKIKNSTSLAVDRDCYRAVQTPQTFSISLLKEAYAAVPYSSELTDDAAVVERFGYAITLSPGSHRNIKITNPEDMGIAEQLLATYPHRQP